MMEWRAGDVVRHKTGGPRMAVVGQTERGFFCQYFDLLGREHTTYFLAANLVDEKLDSEKNLV